jgi:hypothetical protein
MRAYQNSPIAATQGCCDGNLNATCSLSFYLNEDQWVGQLASSECPDVPGSPGRAKRFCPYPPSRRRRR